MNEMFRNIKLITKAQAILGQKYIGSILIIFIPWNLHCMVRNVFCSNGFCKAGCSAMHLTVAPLSDLLTGNNNLEMDVQVRVLRAGELMYPLGNVDGLMSS